MHDDPVIIGIHGLANKPPREEKQAWWRQAIEEGLRRNLGRAPPDVPFAFVYWADLRYDAPVNATGNREPYYPARGRKPFPSPNGKPPGPTLTDRVYRVLEWMQEKTGHLVVDDAFIEYRLDDLWGYHKDAAFRTDARDRLRAVLERYEGRTLLLAAHSMGGLIAYDVLRLAERQGPRPRVAHFITMGSPLGLAEIKHRITAEHGDLRVPTAVARWTHLGDRDDVATVGADLAQAYAPNRDGVRVVDCPVINAYRRPRGGRNPHKSYGYLRTPEFSRAVADVLDGTATARGVEADAAV